MFAAATLAAAVVPALAQQPLTEREKELLARIAVIEKRLAELERATKLAPASNPVTQPAAPATGNESTVSAYFDGYYAWNANRPEGRAMPLRAYDVKANNFSINQAGLLMEKSARNSSRWGYRLDLMFGQATETLQGSAANESRPFVYRNVFQAYGTYLLPAGSKDKFVTVDFGKWASALGPESNYTKDQINYSRSYFFNYLPFYHMGFRATYPLHDRVSLSYWLVNGANQAEDFNGFKSQLVQVLVKPARNLVWTVNYYNGREQRDNLPLTTPKGKFHVIDSYAFWNPISELTLGAEFDCVLNRVEANGAPQRIVGGAGYFRYQLTQKTYFGQRYVRLNDRAGLFSGLAGNNLNDLTSTIGYRPADGFEARVEYRRDFSNLAYFPKRGAGALSKHQDSFTLGLLWWFGGKAGSW
jgi:hypothetical protein